MTSPGTDFDLLEQPWIHTVDPCGHLHELSLREVFARAHEMSAVTGELPTQAFAILRLLTAVLYRAVAEHPGSPSEKWKALWGSGSDVRKLPVPAIGAYLDTHRHRFGLLDPDQPFMQVAGLRSDGDAVSGLDRLIADVPNGDKYFTTRSGEHLQRIDFAEAARWLVHAHGFDPSGIKTGAAGDPRVKKGKGYPIGVAWAGCLGGVFVEGATLAETLLLNLVLCDRERDPYSENDLPVWERPAQGPAQRTNTPVPAGPVDLLTWQSRRIRLVCNSSHVTGVVLCNGDALEPFNRHRFEQMSAWRYSAVQFKKTGQHRYYPITHDPQRALWRGLTSLLGRIGGATAREAPVPPGVAEWIRYLIDEDALADTHPLRLHAIGMEYINNQSVVGDLIDDTLGFRAGLLAANPQLRVCALNAVQAAADSVNALANLAGNLARAVGGDPTGAVQRAREDGFFALDSPFREWLATLQPGGDLEADSVAWQITVRSIIEPAAVTLLDTGGPPAWIGRVVDGTLIDAGIAQIWFRRKLKDVLPAAHPRTDDEDTAA